MPAAAAAQTRPPDKASNPGICCIRNRDGSLPTGCVVCVKDHKGEQMKDRVGAHVPECILFTNP